MKVETTDLADVLLFSPRVFSDERGTFFERFNQERYQPYINEVFVQDNQSSSVSGVLRGLHLQVPPHAQGKLVEVMNGDILDVVVDLRPGSATFGAHARFFLSSETPQQLWVPPGCAHGFVVRGASAVVAYKCTALYAPDFECTLRYDDPDLAIDWEVTAPIVSEKDAAGLTLAAVVEKLTMSDDSYNTKS